MKNAEKPATPSGMWLDTNAADIYMFTSSLPFSRSLIWENCESALSYAQPYKQPWRDYWTLQTNLLNSAFFDKRSKHWICFAAEKITNKSR